MQQQVEAEAVAVVAMAVVDKEEDAGDWGGRKRKLSELGEREETNGEMRSHVCERRRMVGC